jgi:lysophospholipase L1-like esterase
MAVDNVKKNYFIYRNNTGLLHFAPWDFDATFGMKWDGTIYRDEQYWPDINDGVCLPAGAENCNALFTRLNSTSPAFKSKLSARWNELKNSVYTTENLSDRFQRYLDELVPIKGDSSNAFNRNKDRWPGSGGEGSDTPEVGEIDWIEDWISRRLAYVDEKISQTTNNPPIDPDDNNPAPDLPDSDFSAQLRDNRFDVCIEVDAASTQSGANVQAANCSTNPVDDHQIFDFVLNSGSNIYNIRPRHSALCLEVDAGSPNNRANIQQASCNNSAEQQFSVSPDGDTFAIYTNTGDGSKVLDASATVGDDGARNLIQWTDQAKGNQRWTFIDHSTQPPIDNTTALKIMAIGDSITQGTKGEESYRPKFVTLLEETSCNFEMVGSRNSINPPPHEGYSGHRIEHFINGGTFNSITNPGVTAMLNAESPNVIFIHLGTNDIRRGDSATETVGELEELVDIIESQTEANAQIFVANIVPWYQDLDGGGINDDETPAMNQYKDAIELSLADTSQGKLGSYPNVTLVDVHTGFEYTDMHFDGTAYEGLHPGPDGEQKIAQAFYNAFTLVDACANN